MSHTIGQNTEDNQKLKADRKSSTLDHDLNPDASVLSNADYEFLFNQLLEGVAHGWHDLRIVKFFDLLGDRGKAENWVAWLERSHPQLITLPLQSKRQLGTLMARLGELTHANPKIGEIGRVSNRIGRELLFGNTEDVVWEYVGPDLVLDPPAIELETPDNASERLPENFAELGTVNASDAELMAASTAEADLAADAPTETVSESDSEEEIFLLDLDTLEDFPESLPVDDLDVRDLAAEDDLSVSMVDESATMSAKHHSDEPVDNLAADNALNDEFEFELDTLESSLDREDLSQNAPNAKTSAEPKAIFERDRELLDIVESFHSPSSALDSQQSDRSEELSQLDSKSLDAERVLNLIQEDENLAREISEKLNISSNSSNSIARASNNPSNSFLAESINLDRSSIELIEGWFNLGLKQVSGGEFDKAIASWEKALNINPNLSEAWHNRGSALGRLGKYSEAVESFQKALTINPQNYQAWNDRAHALYQLKNWAAAADSWSNAIKITPTNHLFWYNRGCALEQLESWAESISSYEKSLEIKPDFQPARSRYTNLIADNSR